MVNRRASKVIHVPSFDSEKPSSVSHLHCGGDANAQGASSNATNRSLHDGTAISDCTGGSAKDRASATFESKLDIYSIDDDEEYEHSDSDDELNGADCAENPDDADGQGASSDQWDQLRFDHFIGREDELERLKSIYARICRKPSKTSDDSNRLANGMAKGAGKGNKEPQVVLIHGYSGTGKSALVNRFLGDLGVTMSPPNTTPSTSNEDGVVEQKKRQADLHPCHVGKGKYDQFKNAGNLSAIVDALSSLFDHLKEAEDILESKRIRDTLCKKLNKALRSRMCKIIPGLSNMLEWDIMSCRQIDIGEEDMASRQERMKIFSKPSRMMNRNKYNAGSEGMEHAAPSIDEYSVSAKSMTTISLFDADQRGVVGSREKEWPRIVHGFKVILKAICTDDHPLVLYLDDLQWVDERSLKLITEILIDPSIRNLLIIGSYRSNEVHNDPQHQLTTAVSQWETNGKTIHDIPLNDLTITQTAEFLASSLRLDTTEAAPLAKLLHDKTKGNVLYTMQALEGLRRRKALTRNIHTLQWEWDEQRAADEIDLSANVVDLITSKLHSLPDDLQKCLQMASFLRSTFRQSLLETLMDWEMEQHQIHQTDGENAMRTLSVTEMSVGEALDMAVKEELLERTSANPDAGPAEAAVDSGATFRFAHDRIQQAAFSLSPPGDELDQMKFRVGKYLMEIGSDPMLGEDWMWFMAADHLENVSSLTVSDHIIPTIDLINLNLKAGQLAVGVSAFVPAAKYLNQALTNLEIKIADPWETQYGLCRDVYHSLSEIELTLGNYETGSMLCQTIVERSDQYVEDKILVNMSLVKALNRLERFKESLDLQLESLKLLKTFPVRNHIFLALRDKRKINTYFSKHTDEDIMKLPAMKDPKIKLTMEILHRATHSAHCSSQIGTLIFILFRQVRLILKHGLCAEGAYSFCAAGVILLNTFKEVDLGKRLCALSRRILDATDSKHIFGSYIAVMGIYIDAWSKPVHVCLADLRRGHHDAMETGDLESAYRCWGGSLLFAFVAGLPLVSLHRVGKSYLAQLRHYGLKAIEEIFVSAFATWVVLLGKNDPTAAFAEDKWRHLADSMSVKDPNPSEWASALYSCWGSIQLATFFGDLEVAKKYVAPLERLCKIEHSMVALALEAFHSGLTMSRLAQRITNNNRKRRKYYRRSKQRMRTLKAFIETKGGNSLHRYMIMQADAMAASGKQQEETVKAAYDKAISISARSGHIHETALANELAAEYFLLKSSSSQLSGTTANGNRRSSRDFMFGEPSTSMYENTTIVEDDTEWYWPRLYLRNAISLYNEWGAKAKVEQLLKKYPDLLHRSMVEGCIDGSDGGEINGRRRNRRMTKHTADTRMCVTTAHKMMAEVNFDAL